MKNLNLSKKYIVCWRSLRNGFIGRGKPLNLDDAKAAIDRAEKGRYKGLFRYWLEEAN